MRLSETIVALMRLMREKGDICISGVEDYTRNAERVSYGVGCDLFESDDIELLIHSANRKDEVTEG